MHPEESGCGTLEACAGGPSLAPEFIENVGGLDPKDVNPISFSLTKFPHDQQRLRITRRNSRQRAESRESHRRFA